MQRSLPVLEHYMVQYLVVGSFGVAAAYLFFSIGGSLAEVAGQEKTLLGISFKAGGAFAGFLVFYSGFGPINRTTSGDPATEPTIALKAPPG